MSKLLVMGEKNNRPDFDCVLCVCVQFSFIFFHICEVLHEYSLK